MLRKGCRSTIPIAYCGNIGAGIFVEFPSVIPGAIVARIGGCGASRGYIEFGMGFIAVDGLGLQREGYIDVEKKSERELIVPSKWLLRAPWGILHAILLIVVCRIVTVLRRRSSMSCETFGEDGCRNNCTSDFFSGCVKVFNDSQSLKVK